MVLACWPNPKVSFLCIFLIALALRAYADSQEPPVSKEYVLKTWDANDGLPNNHVCGLAQTPDGYLWLATWWGGLVRFDGVQFTPVETGITEGKRPGRVQTVYTSRDGTLWVGLDQNAVVRSKEGHFETVIPPASPQDSTGLTNSFAEDASGAIWFGYLPGPDFYRLDHGRLTQFSTRKGISLGWEPSLHADIAGRIWVSARDGCGVFNGEQFQTIDLGKLGGRLVAATDGGMWAIRSRQLVHYWETGMQEVIADLDWLEPDGGINVFYKDSQGNLWIGTRRKGLFRYRPGRPGNFVKVPTSHSDILSLLEDREGNLWVGTEGGLNRLRSSAFTLHQTKDGLLSESVVSLCADQEGRIWLAGRDGVPVRSLDSSNQSFALPPGWSFGAVMAMHPDLKGGVWLGLFGDLIYWGEGVFSSQKLYERIIAVQEDNQGDLWLSTAQKGLVRRHANQIEQVPASEGMNLPRALALDPQGRLWVGTDDGRVFYREKGVFRPVPLAETNPGETIRFIVPDGKETVWIGAFGGGLYRWREGKISHLSQDAGLPSQDFRSLIIDASRDFWFGVGQGLFRVTGGELTAVLDGRATSFHPDYFGRDDGVPSVEYSFGFRNATARTPDGHLWFATYSGALEIAPERLKKPSAPVPMLIEAMRVDGHSVPCSAGKKIVLGPHPGSIQIRYTLPQLGAPEHVRFRHRLVEGDDNPAWIEAGAHRSADFPRLSAGSYRFEVEANDSFGQSTGPRASLGLVVLPAWWETGWFQFACALAGIVGLSWTVRFVVKRRMRARMRTLEQEAALERERARLARDLHDEVGASLTRIALIAELPPSPGNSARLAETAREAVDALDGVVWAVDPGKDTLANLLQYLVRYAEDFLKTAGMLGRVDFPTDVPQSTLFPEFRHNVLMMFKEALSNAVKYSGGSEVRLSAGWDADGFTLVIADNGTGFDASASDAFGHGLRNMRDRAKAIGGECRIDSHSNMGTNITFRLPWPDSTRSLLK